MRRTEPSKLSRHVEIIQNRARFQKEARDQIRMQELNISLEGSASNNQKSGGAAISTTFSKKYSQLRQNNPIFYQLQKDFHDYMGHVRAQGQTKSQIAERERQERELAEATMNMRRKGL